MIVTTTTLSLDDAARAATAHALAIARLLIELERLRPTPKCAPDSGKRCETGR